MLSLVVFPDSFWQQKPLTQIIKWPTAHSSDSLTASRFLLLTINLRDHQNSVITCKSTPRDIWMLQQGTRLAPTSWNNTTHSTNTWSSHQITFRWKPATKSQRSKSWWSPPPTPLPIKKLNNEIFKLTKKTQNTKSTERSSADLAARVSRRCPECKTAYNQPGSPLHFPGRHRMREVAKNRR